MRPPRIVEIVVGSLTPFSRREEVLGDLCEAYVDAGSYIASAIRMLPQIVFSQMRRNTDWRVFLLEALGVIYSFTAAAFRSDRPLVFEDQWGLVRLAIPALTVLAVLLLRNAYADTQQRPHYASTLDIGFAFAFALLSQVVLSSFRSDLALPRWAPTQGGLAGWLFLSIVRAMFPPQAKAPRPEGPMFVDEVRWRAEEFEIETRRWSLRGYFGASVLIVLFVWLFVRADLPGARAGSGLILTGAIYVIYQIRKRGSSRAVPGLETYRDVFRSELERQQTLLYRLWYCCFWALIPGCVLLLLGSRVYEFFILLYLFLFAELIRRTAQGFKREMELLKYVPRI